MRIMDLFSIAKEYLLVGIIAVAVFAIVIAIGYFWVYKKILHGKKTIKKNNAIWLIIFGIYLVVVLLATVLDRSYFIDYGKRVIPLFYSYKSAWNTFSAIEWRNIILNICMFVPFGFLLPLGVEKARKWWVTYACGFFFTVIIESVQLITGRGVAECDDVLNNFIGCMIGYGFYTLVIYIYECLKGKMHNLKNVILSFIPLIGTAIIFGAIFATYNMQEFGNLQIKYIIKANVSNVSTDEKLSDEKLNYPVYAVEGMDKKETKEFADKFLKNLGDKLDDSLTDLYDDTAIYRGEGGNVSVNYIDGTYSFVDFDDEEEDGISKTDSNVTEEYIEKRLNEYGVYIPSGCTFENKVDGVYSFNADKIIEGDTMYNGTIEVTCYEGNVIGNIDYNVIKCSKLKDVECISFKEAYNLIKEGKFKYYSNEKLDIRVKKINVNYITDTKGYYQPEYACGVDINGEETKIDIPAMEK